MESWRNELYNSLSHSVEGSTWKEHKYVAIVNGKYIYPEDLKEDTTTTSSNPNKKSYALDLGEIQNNKASQKSTKTTDIDGIKIKDKGHILNRNYLPKEPEIGDMYFIEDTQQNVYWDGEAWIAYKEKKKSGSYVSGGSGKDNSEYTISPKTIQAIRTLLGSGSSSSKTASKKSAGGGGR